MRQHSITLGFFSLTTEKCCSVQCELTVFVQLFIQNHSLWLNSEILCDKIAATSHLNEQCAYRVHSALENFAIFPI